MKLLIVILFMVMGVLSSFTGAGPKPRKPASVSLIFEYDSTCFPAGGDTIAFSPGKSLTWNDFIGKVPVEESSAVANSAVGFKFSAGITSSRSQVNITIRGTAYFVKSKSWARNSGKSDYILHHEQLHFNIARLGLEKFRQLVTGARLTEANFNQAISKAFSKAWSDYLNIQNRYDLQTNHSIKRPEQQQWNTLVAEGLQQLK